MSSQLYDWNIADAAKKKHDLINQSIIPSWMRKDFDQSHGLFDMKCSCILQFRQRNENCKNYLLLYICEKCLILRFVKH